MSVMRICEQLQPDFVTIPVGCNKFTITQSVENGVISRQGEFRFTSVRDKYGDCPASDFSVANYQALGIVSRLTPAVLSRRDVDAIESNINSLLSDEK